MDPKVSVIIALYNYARYLPEAVGSVIRQTTRDFEVIIVNDGSTDSSRQVAEVLMKNHPNHRIRLIDQANQGLATARNVGVRASKGKYILPLDADDKLAPTALQKMSGLLDTTPGISIAYSWIRYFGDNNRVVRFQEYSFEALKGFGMFMNCSSMFSKRAWKICGGYNPNMRWGWEDYEFWVNCGKHGFYGKLIPEPLLLIRKHEGQMTDEITKKHLGELIAQVKKNHPEIYNV